MLPLRIKAKNLGIIPDIDIDLRGVNCASIVGPNGIGKTTTFTVVPTYCLYGVTKLGRTENGITIDNLLRTGEHDLLALIEFEHSGQEYQIMRTYTDRGKGKSTLDFQIKNGDKWESLNGTTIKETQAKIIELIGIDVDAFVSSSMVLQNKSNEFANKSAGDRKSVYTQILGLKIYDQLQAAAKKKADTLAVQLEADKIKLADLEERLKYLPMAEADLQLTNNNIAYVATDIRTKETELGDIQKVIKDLEAKEQEAKQIEKQIDALTKEVKDKQSEITVLENKIAKAEQVLKNEDFILAQVKALEEIKSQIPSLQAKENKIQQLKAENKKLIREGLILTDDKNGIEQKIEALEYDLSYRDELKQASEEYQQSLTELSALDQTAEEWQLLQDDILAAEKRVEQYGSCLNQLRTELKNYETKSTLLQTANCPISGEINCVFLKDATEAKKQIPIVDSDIMATEKERQVIFDLVKGLAEQQEALRYDKTYHADLKKRIEQLRQKAELYSSLVGKEELLENLKGQQQNLSDRIKTIQEQVDGINVEIIQLQQETENLPILKAKIPTLEKYVTEKDKLPEAKAVIAAARETMAKLDAEIEDKNIRRGELQGDYLSLHDGYSVALSYNQEQLTIVQRDLKALQDGQTKLFVLKGTHQAKLDVLHKDQEEHTMLSSELAPKSKELTRWQLLFNAYGKSGIQALIIDSNLPEQQRLSNEILSQMTNGENTLRFDTQREKKTKPGQIETLDIWVADSSGYERIYETYSGGQKLRIDLALSLGLAALSASKIGSKIEFTVLDEVFGSQDTEHRQLVVDAIKAISSRFKMVLVISHIEQVQAAFDQQIVLSEGGKVEIIFN